MATKDHKDLKKELSNVFLLPYIFVFSVFFCG
jgi:hypothetical protein